MLILAFTVTFAVICFLLFWGNFYFFSESSLKQLPALPEKPSAIVGIELPDWYDANPIVQTASGNIYSFNYNLEINSNDWTIVENAEYEKDFACDPKDEAKIVETSGNIVDCRAIVLTGEWCPPPINAYAISEQGNIWEYSKPQPCAWLYYFYSFAAGIVGFVLGSFVAIIRIILRKTAKVN
jgi:hypothetical protein